MRANSPDISSFRPLGTMIPMLLPIASRAEYPNSCSAPAFQLVIVPSRSIVTMALSADDPAKDSLGASLAHDDPNKIGDILGSKLPYDVRTMDLDGAWADPQLGGSLLAGGAGYELGQYFAFAL